MIRFLATIASTVILTACTQKHLVHSDSVEYQEDALVSFPYKPTTITLESADPKSFETLDGDYGKDSNSVFFKWLKIEGANPLLFEVVGNGYSKDDSNVFFNHRRVESAQANSFELWMKDYGKDSLHIFFNGSLLENADADSFENLQYLWARDKDAYFYGAKRVGACDLDSFTILEEVERSPSRALDDECYFFSGSRVSITDRNSLEVLPAYYAKDRNQVFWVERVVQAADPKTFEAMGFDHGVSVGRDKNSCFFNERAQVFSSCDGFFAKAEEFCGCGE